MIRKLLFPLCFILLCSPCHSEAFLSNALGQNLGAIPALTGSGYEGESEDGRTVIYHDGSVIKTRQDTEDGYVISYGDTTESVRLGDDGERLEWRLETPERAEVHTYFYEDGRLSSVSVSINGELRRRIVYLDTPSGSLSAITGSSDSYISPSFYLYELDGESIRFNYHDNGVITREDVSDPSTDYEVEDDGSWKEIVTLPDGQVREWLFSPDGRLSEERTGDTTTRYEYDENGDLVLSVELYGDDEIRTSYENGRIALVETVRAGVMERERRFLDNGDIEETRYNNGQPEYRILFDGDGVRVKEIHRL